VISANLEVHLPVAGLDELAADVVKREKKLATLRDSADNLRTKMAAPGFAKSTLEVQAELKAKLELMDAEGKTLSDSITELMSMFTPSQHRKYKENQIAAVDAEIKKQEGQLAKCEANVKKTPDNKKNIAALKDKQDEIVSLQARRQLLASELATLPALE